MIDNKFSHEEVRYLANKWMVWKGFAIGVMLTLGGFWLYGSLILSKLQHLLDTLATVK